MQGHVTERDGFEASFFKQLAQLESGFWWFEARNELITWAIKRWSPKASSFLEIGCGTGFVLNAIAQLFPKMAMTGSEFFPEGLVFAAERTPSATFVQLDARVMPYHAQFDAIGAFDVIEHIDDDEAVLRGMREALKPGGVAFITVPQHPFLWSAMDDYAHHERRYVRSDLNRKLIAAGFEPIALRSFVSLLLPLMLAARLRPTRGEYDPGAEYRISPKTNRALHSAMRLEATMIRAGTAFPFGGSLLAIARAIA